MRRRHRAHPRFTPSVPAERLRDFLVPEFLAAAHYRPMLRLNEPFGAVDLTFEREGETCTVPMVLIDPPMLVEPEDDPLIWPEVVAERADDASLQAISHRVCAWLAAKSLSGGLNAPATRVFAAPKLRAPLFGVPPPPMGGSSGRILIAVRKDASQTPDADIDDAHELARRLRAEGFDADVRSQLCDDVSAYDLVHAIGLIAAQDVDFLFERAQAAGKPIVLTPALDDPQACGVWGAALSRHIFGMTVDERDLQTYLRHLAAGNLSIPGFAPNVPHEPQPGFDAASKRARSRAGAILDDAYLNTGVAAGPERPDTGGSGYVLVHAPIEPRNNQVMIVRAAREAGLPLVLAGPAGDAAYLELVREGAAADMRLLPEPSPQEIAALYAGARVFADATWFGYGPRRLATAAAYGCAVVASSLRGLGGAWGEGLIEADPRSVEAIAQALRRAWNAPTLPALTHRLTVLYDPAAAFSRTVAAYAQAQSALNCAPRPADIQR